MQDDEERKMLALLKMADLDQTTLTDQHVKLYMHAIDNFKADEVLVAVDNFIRGNVPGWDGRFRPSAPQLAMECRRISSGDRAFRKVWNKEAIANNQKRLTVAKRRDAQGNVMLPEAFQEYKKNLGDMEHEKWKVWAEREEARMQEVNAHWSPPYGQLAIEAMRKKDQE